jgi:pimeloyl-ACP methyl ester carboxylesterase
MEHSSFYAGGWYVRSGSSRRMVGQALVTRVAPEKVRQPYPLVIVHGGHQSSVNFETTPDGRPGWAHDFAEAGYAVYLMDQPGMGRSAFLADTYGPLEPAFPRTRVEQRFTAVAKYNLWPTAALHTQWAGTGQGGDDRFDQFYASQVAGIGNPPLREQLVRAAGAALLDRIGPAIVISHSLSGSYGWHIADARPELVRAVIAIEPPRPFYDAVPVGPPDYFVDGGLTRLYGLTITPIAYDPPVRDPLTELACVASPASTEPEVMPCYLQREPARSLLNLSRAPVALVTGEASWHTGYDAGTVRYLRQCKVDATHLELARAGIHGNGHMMMLERNSAQIAHVLDTWLQLRELAVPDRARAGEREGLARALEGAGEKRPLA